MLFALSLLCCCLAANAPDEPTPATGNTGISVLVLPLEAKAGVSADFAQLITAALVHHADTIPGYRIVAFQQVEGAMNQEQRREMAGCVTVSCALEIAGSLNTEQFIIGNLGQVGNEFLLTITRVQSRNAETLGRSMQRYAAGKESAILDDLPSVVATLFGTKEEAANVKAPATTEPIPAAEQQSAAPVMKSEPTPVRPVTAAPEPAGSPWSWRLRMAGTLLASAAVAAGVPLAILGATTAGISSVDGLTREGTNKHRITANQALANDVALVGFVGGLVLVGPAMVIAGVASIGCFLAAWLMS